MEGVTRGDERRGDEKRARSRAVGTVARVQTEIWAPTADWTNGQATDSGRAEDAEEDIAYQLAVPSVGRTRRVARTTRMRGQMQHVRSIYLARRDASRSAMESTRETHRMTVRTRDGSDRSPSSLRRHSDARGDRPDPRLAPGCEATRRRLSSDAIHI